MAECPFCHDDPETPVVARWSMFMALTVFSQNDLTKTGPGFRFVYKKKRTAYEWFFVGERARLGIPLARRRRRATFVRFYSGREREWDMSNLVGGLKPVLDSMVKMRLLTSDTRAGVVEHYDQVRHDVLSGLGITLEEIG